MGAAEVDPQLATNGLDIFPIQPLTSKQIYTIVGFSIEPT